MSEPVPSSNPENPPASESYRESVVRTALIIGFILNVAYGIAAYTADAHVDAFLNGLNAAGIAMGLVLLQWKRMLLTASLCLIITCLPLFLFDVATASNEKFDLIWSLLLPIFTILLIGRKAGIWLLASYWGVCAALLFAAPSNLTVTFKVTFLIIFAVITFSIWLYETFRVNALSRQAESERAFRVSQAEKEELREQLHQVEKLDAVGKLAGGIAHDFNNQLTGIVGFAELVTMVARDKVPEAVEYAERIKRIGNRASELNAQLLAFARKGRYLMVRVDVHPLIADTCAILERSIDKRIRVEQRLLDGTPAVLGDPSQLQSLILNLAINARDAMEEGGHLTLTTSLAALSPGDPLLAAHSALAGDYVRIEVADTGTGMTDEVRRRMFEPFFTTKGPGKGTGIGLAAVYGTVLGHKGCISVKSAPGKGSEIAVYLPLLPAGNESGPAKAVSPLPPQTGYRILVIDDEKPVREMLEALLTVQGHKVEIRPDGLSAEAWYRDHWREVDLVLLDMVMPDLNGRATWERLKAVSPGVRVLLISGYSMEGEAQEMLSLGVQGFLQKPFTASVLEAAMKQVMVSAGPQTRA